MGRSRLGSTHTKAPLAKAAGACVAAGYRLNDFALKSLARSAAGLDEVAAGLDEVVSRSRFEMKRIERELRLSDKFSRH